MSKDKIIGAAILVGALVVLVVYTIWLIFGYVVQEVGTQGSWAWLHDIITFDLFGLPWELAVILPMWLVAVLVLAIAMWIGYSMLTTPPPVPLEELEEELEAEEAAEESSE